VSQCTEERQKFGRFYYRLPNGEAGTDVFDRVSDFWSTLLRSMDTSPVENLVSLCGDWVVLVKSL
jgi:broad specificity phosphatase PhoE